MDQHLYTTKGSLSNIVLWRPQEGNSVALNPTDYRPFSQVVRTVHLDDALDICVNNYMEPKLITSLSSLKSQVLPPNHPCKNLQVLWFGAKYDGIDEDAHDWYGNVEFAISADTLMHRWSNYYLVEMVTRRTHSNTRILVTNYDYSSVLPPYDPHRHGGGWYFTSEGRHQRLADCRRYNGEGYNRHGHTLEFMIEVTPFGMGKILEETQISFRNHEKAITNGPYACHRFKGPHNCPTPFSRACTSRWFFHEHFRLNAMATPRLSPSSEEFLECFLTMQGIPRNNLPVLAPPPFPSLSSFPAARLDHQPHPSTARG